MEAAARCAQHAGNSHTALWLSGSFREADYTSRRAEQRVVIKLVMWGEHSPSSRLPPG